MVKAIPTQALGTFGKLLRKLYVLIFLAFIFFVLLKAMVISYEEKTPFAGISYLGGKLLYPTLSLYENSEIILENDSFVVNNSIWQTMLVYSDIFSSLISIFFWLWILKWFALKGIVFDDSKNSVGYLIAFILFFGIQAIALAVRGDSPLIVWEAMKSFVKSIIHIAGGFGGVGDKFIKSS